MKDRRLALGKPRGQVPAVFEPTGQLRELPCVGYGTSGSIASMVFCSSAVTYAGL
jgi:hypothetical protein